MIRLYKKWKDFSKGKKMIIYSDAKILNGFLNEKEINNLDILTKRWLMELQQANIDVRHIAGGDNQLADYIKRYRLGFGTI